MKLIRCHTCTNDYDMPAFLAHFTTDQRCPGDDYIATACTHHGTHCPYTDPTYRETAGGWNDRTRICHPLFRLAAGRATNAISDTPRAATWLTLSPPPKAARLQAPRPPSAIGARR